MRCDNCTAPLPDPEIDLCEVCCPTTPEDRYTALDAEIDRLTASGRYADAEYLATGG